jgi:hypothetical protein
VSVGAIVVEQRTRGALERRNFEAVRSGAAQLEAIGRESGSLQLALGNALLSERRVAEARESYRRGQQLLPSAKADLLLAATYEQEGDWRRGPAVRGGREPLSKPERTAALAQVVAPAARRRERPGWKRRSRAIAEYAARCPGRAGAPIREQ